MYSVETNPELTSGLCLLLNSVTVDFHFAPCVDWVPSTRVHKTNTRELE